MSPIETDLPEEGNDVPTSVDVAGSDARAASDADLAAFMRAFQILKAEGYLEGDPTPKLAEIVEDPEGARIREEERQRGYVHDPLYVRGTDPWEGDAEAYLRILR